MTLGKLINERPLISPGLEMSSAHETCTSDDICSIIKAIKSIGSEWSLIISYYLLEGPKGFNDLLRAGRADDLNSRTLSRTLKALLKRGIVDRTIVSTQPFSVSYSLTGKGRALEPILNAYRSWGTEWLTRKAEEVQPPILEVRTRTGQKI